MKIVNIDCAGITDARQLHEILARALTFPDWYGNNLDALYDCLTALGEETVITLCGTQSMGRWEKSFLRVLADAARENPRLTWYLPEQTE